MGTVSEQEIACQQVLLEDGSVFSIQWSIFPARLAGIISPQFLLECYLDYIRKLTATLIRPQFVPEGVEFRLLNTRISLLSFQHPSIEDRAVVLRISGGILVQPRQCERGELRFQVEEGLEGLKVLLELDEFCPLILGSSSPSFLRRWAYSLTQAYIHKIVTVRFLAMLYRDMIGQKIPVRVVKVKVREGRPV